MTTYATGQGVAVIGEDDRTARLDVLRGDERAWLQLAYATTTPDAPECLGLPNCTVLRPWAPARGGSVEVAVTETTVPPNTISTALRGPGPGTGQVFLAHNEATLFLGVRCPDGFFLPGSGDAAAGDHLEIGVSGARNRFRAMVGLAPVQGVTWELLSGELPPGTRAQTPAGSKAA